MDFQKLVDTMNEASKQERGNYHLTLGKLIKKLKAVDGGRHVVCSDYQNEAPGFAMSYRGYYSDLAFAPVEGPTTARKFLAECEAALNTEMEGYKGGNFLMGEDVPLWVAHYGSASGRAVMDLIVEGENAVLVIKQVDN